MNPGSHSITYTDYATVETGVPQQVGYMAITLRSTPHCGVPKYFTGTDDGAIATGEPAFDDHYLLYRDDIAGARAWFDPETAQKFAALSEKYPFLALRSKMNISEGKLQLTLASKKAEQLDVPALFEYVVGVASLFDTQRVAA